MSRLEVYLALTVLLLSASPSLAEYACAPPAEAGTEIEALPALDDSSLTRERVAGPRQALVAKYPNNLLLPLRLLDASTQSP